MHVDAYGSKENNILGSPMSKHVKMEDFTQAHQHHDLENYQSIIITVKRPEELDTCRICFDGIDGGKLKQSPCLCKGSLSLVHEKCFESWIRESARSNCEICSFKYIIGYETMPITTWTLPEMTEGDKASVKLYLSLIFLLVVANTCVFVTILSAINGKYSSPTDPSEITQVVVFAFFFVVSIFSWIILYSILKLFYNEIKIHNRKILMKDADKRTQEDNKIRIEFPDRVP